MSAQFMHLPLPALTSLHERLTTATRPGGMLLVVQHHPDDIPSHGRRDLFMTADQLVGTLDPARWSSIEIAAEERTATHANGDPVTRRDHVLVAIRAH